MFVCLVVWGCSVCEPLLSGGAVFVCLVVWRCSVCEPLLSGGAVFVCLVVWGCSVCLPCCLGVQCLYALLSGGAVFVDASRYLVPIAHCSYSCDFSFGTVKSHV